MQLLKLKGPNEVQRVFATALGMSMADEASVKDDIVDMLGRNSEDVEIEVEGALTCAELFDEYWRTLSRT